MTTLLYIAGVCAALYLIAGFALARYGVSQGEAFSIWTVIAWPRILMGK